MFATKTREHDKKLMEQYLEQGIEQGAYGKAVETARKLKSLNIDIKTIAISTGLSEEEINTL